jgi:hypothetical protein
MYWGQLTMQPGEQRTMAFTYGLGRIATEYGDGRSFNGRMRLFVGERARTHQPINILAYVRSTDPNQTVTLKLPAGMSFEPGVSATQTVPTAGSAGYSQVSWRVKAAKQGPYVVEADAPRIGVVADEIFVKDRGIFDGE